MPHAFLVDCHSAQSVKPPGGSPAGHWHGRCPSWIMGGRILIVDDEETILFAMHDYFGTLGYAVDCATDLATAKALLHETAYPLVITDLRLGGRDNQEGLEIVTCAHGSYPNTRIVLLTAYGSPALTAEARRLGADAVLNKPMSLPKLAQVVQS